MYTKAFSREFHEDLTRAQRILRVCVELGFKEGIQESWLWLAQRCRRDGAISTWKDLTLTYPQLARRFSPAVENLGIWTSGPSSDGEGEREEARSKVDPAWSRPKDVGQRRVFPSENSSREGVDKKEAAEEEEEQVKSEEVKFEEERDKASPLISSPPLTSRRRGGDGLERPSASTLAQCATSDPVGPKRRLLTAWLAKSFPGLNGFFHGSQSSGDPSAHGSTPPLLPAQSAAEYEEESDPGFNRSGIQGNGQGLGLSHPETQPPSFLNSSLLPGGQVQSSSRPSSSAIPGWYSGPSLPHSPGHPCILLGGGKGLGGGGGTSSSHGSGGGAGGMSGGSRRRVGGGKREGVEDQAPHILEAILALLTSGEATSSEAFGYLLRLLEAMRMEMMAKPSTSPLSSSPSRASDTTLLSLSDGVDEAMSRLVREGLAVKDKEILRPLFGLCSSPSSSEPRGGPSRRDGVWEGPKTRTELVRSRPGAPTLRTEGDIKEGMEAAAVVALYHPGVFQNLRPDDGRMMFLMDPELIQYLSLWVDDGRGGVTGMRWEIKISVKQVKRIDTFEPPPDDLSQKPLCDECSPHVKMLLGSAYYAQSAYHEQRSGWDSHVEYILLYGVQR
ncbi:hypothetical protein BJ684DRAFT_15920 [Piptocephalis cylindrospora]|uniref:Uncharacterized protein n=1 Tax=Piptocephalis cylindrospora TaxID=1907219 RepID=A0A4P9Y453_9FUNG|nr:hypothetical protein BJ684DRAFT_15920 [Piptocephalis cylindrospora]|eukprot:RKP13707.1 hypothetical protein BJ684DRAFT_15920 [Piptocephalis cylindrospora]